jgi:hypothetical protein
MFNLFKKRHAAPTAEDIAWLNTNSLGPAFSAVQADFAPDYDASVNASYSNAVLQLDAL